MTTVTGVKCC